MLRSPAVVVSEYRGAALGVVVALAAALWFAAALGAAIWQVQGATQNWWQRFMPVVYVTGDVDEPAVTDLRAEIEGWSGVAGVEVEPPQDMLARLQQYLDDEGDDGGDVAEELEVAMMPTALIVAPRVWTPGQAEVVSRVEALQVRSQVVAVDAPPARALAWVDQMRWVVAGLVAVVFLGFFGALVGLAGFLRRCQRRERQANHLLEVFGASSSALSRPTLWRGVMLGGLAGLGAGVVFLPWSLATNRLAQSLGSPGMMPALTSAGAAVALSLAGALLGLAVAWWCRRPAQEPMDSELILWQRDET